MPRIGLLSDTHGYLDPKIFKYFEDCDFIWHAGDFGTIEVSDELEQFKPLKGVYGNIDGKDLRLIHPKDQQFELEGFKIWITHIGGYPGNFPAGIKKELDLYKPDIFICGHSHILKIMPDKSRNNLLCINPGAAGIHGFHKVKTIVKFDLEKRKIENMKVIEMGKRA